MPAYNNPPTVKVATPSTPTSQSILNDGITFNFAASRPYYVDPNGILVMQTQGDVTLTSALAAVTATAPDGQPALYNGAMRDFGMYPSQQAFEEYWSFSRLATFSGKTTADFAYSAVLQANPSVAGDQVWASGSRGFYIASVHARFPAGGEWTGSVEKYVPVIFAPSLPAAGKFAPGFIGGPGGVPTNYNIGTSDIRWGVFQNWTRPAALRTATAAQAQYLANKIMPHWSAGAGADSPRTSMVGPWGDYAADIGPRKLENLLAFNWGDSTAIRAPSLYHVIYNSICRRNIIDSGQFGRYGAGQWLAEFAEMVTTGFVTGDTGFLTAATKMIGNDVRVALSPAEFFYNATCPTRMDNNGSVPTRTFGATREMAYILCSAAGTTVSTSGWISHDQRETTSYGRINDAMIIMTVLAIMALRNGPSGETGGEWLVANGFGGMIEYADSMWKSNIGEISSRLTTNVKDAYSYIRPLVTPAIGSGRPQQMMQDHVSAITNGFAFNDRGRARARNTLSDRSAMLSFDRRSGKVFSGLSATQNVTTGVVLGVPQWQMARCSDSVGGPGPWSVGYGDRIGGAEPQITPLGTPPATAPAYGSVLPKLMILPYRQNPWSAFYDCPSTVPVHTDYIYISVGYPDAGGAPTEFDVKLTEGGVDVAGTLQSNITLVQLGGKLWGKYAISGLRGKTIKPAVRARNANGQSGFVEGAACTVPAKTETYAHYSPNWEAPLMDMTQRWAPPVAGGAVSFESGQGQNTGRHGIIVSNASIAAPRLWSIDRVEPLGLLTNVAEGEILAHVGLVTDRQNWAASVLFRCSGDYLTASGYEISYRVTSSGYRVTIYRYNGDGSVTAVFSGSNQTFNAGGYAGDVRFDRPTLLRANWSLNAGEMRVRFRPFNYPREPFQVVHPEPYGLYAEPGTWLVDYTIPGTPCPSGWWGVGNYQTATGGSMRAARFECIAISDNPTTGVGSINPVAPTYAYS